MSKKTLVLNRMAADKDHTIVCVVNSDPEAKIIEVYDTIQNERWYPEDPCVTPEDITSVIDSHVGDIDVRINSRGGDVGAALAMTNRLKDYKRGTVNTIVDGYAFSAAGMMAQAGVTRKICRGGIFMIHNPRMYPEVTSLKDLDSIRNNWMAHQSSILSVFEGRTKVSKEKLQALMEAETFLSAEDAVKAGFFDAIHEGQANYAALNAYPVKGLPETFGIGKTQVVDVSDLRNRRLSAKRRSIG